MIKEYRRSDETLIAPEILLTNHTKVNSSNALGILTIVTDTETMRSAAHNEKIDISINKVIGVNSRNRLSKNVSGTDLALYLSQTETP